ncbi:MAG: transcriptional repressor [Oscillospiraceae bacterium]|nr:transcriptional repressor [Oscillospiraceae bacterium]
MTYMTRQQREVLRCIENCADGACAAELTEQLHREGARVGLTTVYRQLERLEQQGLVHKVVTDQGARYQYCSGAHSGRDCFLLKCERCGRIEHLDCSHLGELYSHILAEHHFRINPRRTLFYGLCQRCSGEDGE